MLIACISRNFIETPGVFSLLCWYQKDKLSIGLAGTAPGNTERFNETLCTRVFTTGEMGETPPTSWKFFHFTSPRKIPFFPLQTHLNNNFRVITQKQFLAVAIALVYIIFVLISDSLVMLILILIDVQNSQKVVFSFEKVGKSKSRLTPIGFWSKGNMPHFRKPVFISPTVIDSHSFIKILWKWSCSSGLVPSIKRCKF